MNGLIADRCALCVPVLFLSAKVRLRPSLPSFPLEMINFGKLEKNILHNKNWAFFDFNSGHVELIGITGKLWLKGFIEY